MTISFDATLTYAPGWTYKVARAVFSHFPDRSVLFHASDITLRAHPFPFPAWMEQFLAWRNAERLSLCTHELARAGLHTVSYDDARYPSLLREIHAPPFLLFVAGTIPVPVQWCAMVGSRQATPYGIAQARAFVRDLASHGVGIVSGLAYGIDTTAIETACTLQTPVLAVIAGGHDTLPARERALVERIVACGGAVISEHRPCVKPEKYFFPVRNRIIAGIAPRVLIVEAHLESGSLVTARHALESNRDVYAIPGNITSTESAGCHALIREGATLCRSVYDLLEMPEPDAKHDGRRDAMNRVSTQEYVTRIPHMHSPLHTTLWDMLSGGERRFDFLVEYTRASETQVAGILNLWEIDGYVVCTQGTYTRSSL